MGAVPKGRSRRIVKELLELLYFVPAALATSYAPGCRNGPSATM